MGVWLPGNDFIAFVLSECSHDGIVKCFRPREIGHCKVNVINSF